MNIDEEIAAVRKSANRAAIIVVVVLFVAFALLACSPGRTFFTGIVHVVELVQAVLVCSTALMGLSGLMIIETKRTKVTGVTGLSSNDIFEKIKAINTIRSLEVAHVFLRWTITLPIVSVIFSGSWFMFNNPVLIIGTLAAFLAQICLFIWGLGFSDFLPS